MVVVMQIPHLRHREHGLQQHEHAQMLNSQKRAEVGVAVEMAVEMEMARQ